jgi:hypothetical protein
VNREARRALNEGTPSPIEQLDSIAVRVGDLNADKAVIILPVSLRNAGARARLGLVRALKLEADVVGERAFRAMRARIQADAKRSPRRVAVDKTPACRARQASTGCQSGRSELVEAVAQTPGEAAGSLLRVGSEIGHLVRRERVVRRKVVPHGGSVLHFRERAARFLRRLCATASVLHSSQRLRGAGASFMEGEGSPAWRQSPPQVEHGRREPRRWRRAVVPRWRSADRREGRLG